MIDRPGCKDCRAPGKIKRAQRPVVAPVMGGHDLGIQIGKVRGFSAAHSAAIFCRLASSLPATHS